MKNLIGKTAVVTGASRGIGVYIVDKLTKKGVNVIGIVINDGALTSIKASQQKAFRGRTIDTNMINPDFVELAKSFGAKGKRVKSLDKFKKVLEEALVNQGPTIIEVLMEDNETQLVDSINWLKSNPLRSP